jgi:hypothetical protein
VPTAKFEDVIYNDLLLLLGMLTEVQWLAVTPPALVKEHLGFSDETMALLTKTKAIVIGGEAGKSLR